MSRQERFDCSALLAGLMALLLIAIHFPQSATASPAAAPTTAVQQTLPEVLTVKPVVSVAAARTWAEATLAGSGVTLPANVSLVYSSVANCGADLSAAAMGGCTYKLADRTVIVISPELAWTAAGSHILFHEIGHALGIDNECHAEEFAHQFEDPANLVWSYPSCNA
jgi:hypothetical protein